jgi:hypothetical protein
MRLLLIVIAVGAVGVIGITQMEYIRCGGEFVRPGTYEIGDRHFILTFTGESRKDNFDEEPILQLKKIEKL